MVSAPEQPLAREAAELGASVAVELRRELDTPDLDEATRAKLTGELLGLGWPHALTVTPEDLALYRAHSSLPTSLIAVKAVAVISMLWSLGGLGLAALVGGVIGDSPFPVTLPFGIALVHAVTALRARRTPALAALAGAGLFGPLFSSLVAENGDGGLLLMGLLVASPAMLTALCCGVAAALVFEHRP